MIFYYTNTNSKHIEYILYRYVCTILNQIRIFIKIISTSWGLDYIYLSKYYIIYIFSMIYSYLHKLFYIYM